MTHQTDDTVLTVVCELLNEYGFDGLAKAMTIVLNEAMKVERTRHLQAAPYERTEARRGYANGYKGKTVKSRVGELRLAVPQVRAGPIRSLIVVVFPASFGPKNPKIEFLGTSDQAI